MTVHVTEAADVHENVKPEPLAAMEGAQQFVVPAAVANTQINDFSPLGRAERLHPLADLPVGIMAGRVEQGSSDFNFKRLFFKQIYQRGWLHGSVRHDLCGSLSQILARLDFVLAGIGILDQSRR